MAPRLVASSRGLIWALAALLPSAALAQQPCAASGLDAFDAARRARRIVSDYRYLHAQATHAAALNAQANALDPEGDWPASPTFMIPVVDYMWWPALTACRDSAPRDASLGALRYGLIGGVALKQPALRLEAFVLRGDDSITIAGGAQDDEQELSQTQSLLGARAQWSRWAALTVGLIEDEQGDARLDPVPRLYLALGVPALNLQTDVILDRRDQSLQTLYLDLDRLPLTDAGLALSARAAYLEDEQQLVTQAGLLIPLRRRKTDTFGMPYSSDYISDHRSDTVWSIFPELSMEWDEPNLRHVRVRALHHGLNELKFGLRFELDVFADLTLFRSHVLEARTGVSNALGAAAGGRVALGSAMGGSLVAESTIAINRPETLAQLSELVHAREYRLQFYFYIPIYFGLEDEELAR